MKISPTKPRLHSASVLAALSIILTFGAVSCKTGVATDKPAAASGANQASAKAAAVKGRYFTCTMHPTVRSLNPDGKCPICDMPLVPAETVIVDNPDLGKKMTAATFPSFSGYYSCAMHPTVLSDDPDGQCPICKMQLFPVESLTFFRDK